MCNNELPKTAIKRENDGSFITLYDSFVNYPRVVGFENKDDNISMKEYRDTIHKKASSVIIIR